MGNMMSDGLLITVLCLANYDVIVYWSDEKNQANLAKDEHRQP
jgi:hypothetical protein